MKKSTQISIKAQFGLNSVLRTNLGIFFGLTDVTLPFVRFATWSGPRPSPFLKFNWSKAKKAPNSNLVFLALSTTVQIFRLFTLLFLLWDAAIFVWRVLSITWPTPRHKNEKKSQKPIIIPLLSFSIWGSRSRSILWLRSCLNPVIRKGLKHFWTYPSFIVTPVPWNRSRSGPRSTSIPRSWSSPIPWSWAPIPRLKKELDTSTRQEYCTYSWASVPSSSIPWIRSWSRSASVSATITWRGHRWRRSEHGRPSWIWVLALCLKSAVLTHRRHTGRRGHSRHRGHTRGHSWKSWKTGKSRKWHRRHLWRSGRWCCSRWCCRGSCCRRRRNIRHHSGGRGQWRWRHRCIWRYSLKWQIRSTDRFGAMTTFGEKTVRGNFTCGGILGGIDGGGTFGGGTPGGGMPIFGGGTELDGGATVGIFGGMIGGGSEIVDDSISFLISSRKKK